MSNNIYQFPVDKKRLDQIIDRMFDILRGKLSDDTKRMIEARFRKRTDSIGLLKDEAIRLTVPEVPGVDPEVVLKVIRQARPALSWHVELELTDMALELMAAELEIWQLRNGEE